MTPTDAELRKLAEAATNTDPTRDDWYAPDFPCENGYGPITDECDLPFIAAFSPTVALSLLDRIAAMEKVLIEVRSYFHDDFEWADCASEDSWIALERKIDASLSGETK